MGLAHPGDAYLWPLWRGWTRQTAETHVCPVRSFVEVSTRRTGGAARLQLSLTVTREEIGVGIPLPHAIRTPDLGESRRTRRSLLSSSFSGAYNHRDGDRCKGFKSERNAFAAGWVSHMCLWRPEHFEHQLHTSTGA